MRSAAEHSKHAQGTPQEGLPSGKPWGESEGSGWADGRVPTQLSRGQSWVEKLGASSKLGGFCMSAERSNFKS